MQELEKILEEIDEATRQEDAPIYCGSMEVDGYVRMSVVRKIIRKHMNDGWISVDKGTPEVGEYVLGTNKYGEVLVYHYGWNSPHTRKMFFCLCGAATTITAWRPLPEPYKPERMDQNEKAHNQD